MQYMPPMARTVHEFWFRELGPQDWFSKNDELDCRIERQFGHLIPAACRGQLTDWRNCLRGRLAEILVLDQFARNVYRGQALAFTGDDLALSLAREAIQIGVAELNRSERRFIYMPFMHSERLVDHDDALVLFSEPGMDKELDYEQHHRAILERFGRYPHRNEALGRISTTAEKEFLKQPGSSF